MSDTFKKLQIALADRYRVERELGQGGMATVYLAHDLRHERDVAIKVLHPDLAAALGAERFLAEIKTTARLSHPHILPLLDSGAAEGFLFYVMPYVPGETLRTRLERERQLPMGDALQLAREVADALGAAHQLGIIHRDVKPENILLQGGHALVADFGIALAVQSAGGARMTQTGLSLGTPQYMSPEQAMGERTIDARADQYALAAVTYEMLAGEPPFTGPTVQAIVAKALSERPTPLSTLRDTVALSVEESVMRGLAKLPADRFGSVAEFAAGLREERINSGATRAATAAVASRGASVASRRVLFVGAALALVGTGLAGWSLQRGAEGPPRAAVQLMLDSPTGADLARFGVSADGEAFVFAVDEGLMVRPAGERDYQLLSGTMGAESPSFSPDGQWIAYHTNGRVRKVATRGGSSVSLVAKDSILSGGVHWGPDGTIVFESAGRVYLVNPDGTALRRLEFPQNAASPRMLPDGTGIVYVDPSQRSMLMLYDIALDTAFVLMEEASAAQYVEPGYLVFSQQDGGLFAAPFDLKRRATTGAPVPLLTDMEVNGVVAPFMITASGALVYRAGVLPEVQLVMREPNGRLDTLEVRPSVVSSTRFSPDGKSLAVTFGSSRGANRQTSILDLATGAMAQFTFEGGGHAPVWSPDGSQLAFTAELDGTDAEDIYVQPLDRRENPRRVVRIPQDQHASAWPRADMLVVSDNNAPATDARVVRGNILLVDPTKTDGKPTVYLSSQWDEGELMVSPDGKWGAYTSTESGQPEIYVRAFPEPRGAGQYKISLDGGAFARWGPGGRTLLYLSRNGVIHEVSVRAEPTVQVGARREVLTVLGLSGAWDVDVNTGRILFAQTVTGATRRMVYVTDWQLLYRANEPRGGAR